MSNYRITIGSKGRVIIPAELRVKLQLKEKTRAIWREENGRLVLIPLTQQRIKEATGFLKPAPGQPSAFDELLAEHKRERKREKA